MPLTHERPVAGSRNYVTETRAVIDEIEFDPDSLGADITGLQTGALPIVPLANMRAGMAHGAISPKEPACQTPSSTYEE